MGKKAVKKTVPPPPVSPRHGLWDRVFKLDAGSAVIQALWNFVPYIGAGAMIAYSAISGLGGPMAMFIGIATAVFLILGIKALREKGIAWKVIIACGIVAGLSLLVFFGVQRGAMVSPLAARANASESSEMPISGPRFLYNKRVATREELEAPHIADRTVYLADIPRGPGGIIREKAFESCIIIGPGIISLGWQLGNEIGHPRVERCGWDAPLDYLYLVIEPGVRSVRGSILCKDVLFRNCSFRDVGIMGTEDAKKDVLRESPELAGN